MNVQEHILLTALGTRADDAYYSLNEVIGNGRLSPIALMQILPPEKRPHRIIALCTKGALKTTFPVLESGVSVPVEAVSIPEGRTEEELWDILHLILEQASPGTRMTLELTQGFRSYPFLFFTAALFLRALRGVDIQAVYYGMLEGKYENVDGLKVAPVVDLYPVLEMIEWFYATRMFKETGQAQLLSACLAPFETPPAGLEREERRDYSQVKRLRENVNLFAMKYAQSLPLELGLKSAELVGRLSNPVPGHLRSKMPVPEEIFRAIHEFVEPFAIPHKQKEGKQTISCDSSELFRQAGMIDTYIEKGYLNYALGLIREWIVTAAMWQASTENNSNWLVYKDRMVTERRLGAMAMLLKNHPSRLLDNQRWLAGHWDYLSDCRNNLHHHGFREKNAFHGEDKVNKIKHCWQELKDSLLDKQRWNTKIAGGGGKLLVTPLGLSRGLLYSALRHINPDKLLVLTSKEMSGEIDEIISVSGWTGEKLPPFVMEDPHSGFGEVKNATGAANNYLLDADQVYINITGGTTALQYLVQEICKTAQKFNREVLQVAMVDRRTPKQQKEEPYVQGELIPLNNNCT